jgi:hypothetical protein
MLMTEIKTNVVTADRSSSKIVLARKLTEHARRRLLASEAVP